jgi:uncharacterized protein (TIGR03437 family)
MKLTMKLATSMAWLAFTAYAQTGTSSTCLPGATTPPTAGSPTVWDASGNKLLTGTYYFRYVQYTVGDQQGDLSHAYALYGTINFTQAGTYVMTGTEVDSNTMQTSGASIPGTYSLSACGYGFLSNPLSPGDVIWGLVAQNGVFVGSTTETQNPFNDLFIAASASPQPNNATLQGSYSVAYMDFPNGYVGDIVTAGFQMAPNGKGGIGTVNIQMYQGSSSGPIDVVEPASYYLTGGANGEGVLAFPSYGQAISMPKLLNVSPDGNLVFGGGPSAFDLFIGVRTAMAGALPGAFGAGFGANPSNDLYYQAGIDEIMSNAGSTGSLQTYYGALQAAAGTIWDHQRILAPLSLPLQPAGYPYQPFSSTYPDSYSLAFGSNAGYTDTATKRQYVIGANGAIRLGFGMYPNLGISIALQAPSSVPPAVPPASTPPPYINPTGILNAASFAPFTSGISPGELIAINGSNFATGLGATQVTINGMILATDVTVGPTGQQLTAIVPSTIAAPSTAWIQVTSNGQPSNVVWAFVNQTTPGVFTQSGTGLGGAVATHSDSTAVTPCHPATAGETISVDTTGLGAVNPSAIVGTAFGSQTFTPVALITATIGNVPAVVTFPALSPSTNGHYAMAVTVPATGVTPGNVSLVISSQAAVLGSSAIGLDATTALTTIAVGTASTASPAGSCPIAAPGAPTSIQNLFP